MSYAPSLRPRPLHLEHPLAVGALTDMPPVRTGLASVRGQIQW